MVGASERALVGKDIGLRLNDGEDRAAGEHTHAYADASSFWKDQASKGWGRIGESKSISRTTSKNADSVEGTNAPYRTVFFCVKI